MQCEPGLRSEPSGSHLGMFLVILNWQNVLMREQTRYPLGRRAKANHKMNHFEQKISFKATFQFFHPKAADEEFSLQRVQQDLSAALSFRKSCL